MNLKFKLENKKGLEMAIGTVAILALVLIVLVVLVGFFAGGFGKGGTGIQGILDVGKGEADTGITLPGYTDLCVGTATATAAEATACEAHATKAECDGGTSCEWKEKVFVG